MIYSIKNDELYQMLAEAPADGTDYCITPESFDLSIFRVIVGLRDAGKNLIVRTVQVKNSELLLRNQQEANNQITAMGQQISAMVLSDAQKSAKIVDLEKQVAALSTAEKAGE